MSTRTITIEEISALSKEGRVALRHSAEFGQTEVGAHCAISAARQNVRRWRKGAIMTDHNTLTSAEKVVRFAYSMREDGFYCRPRDGELRDFGGRMISSSNDGETTISFSPTDVWEFKDGSRVEIAYSDATVIAGAALAVVREGDQTIGVWSMGTAPTQFLRELVEQAVENGEASAQDADGCTVTAVRQDGEQ